MHLLRLETSAVLFALILVGGRLSAAPPARQVPPEALDAINAMAPGVIAAWNGADPAAVAAFYAEDAVVVIDGGRIFKGREEILAGYLDPLVAIVSELQTEIAGAFGSEHTVTFVGRYTARFTPPGEVRTESFSNTWVRQPDGGWKIRASVTETRPEAPPAQPSNALEKFLARH